MKNLLAMNTVSTERTNARGALRALRNLANVHVIAKASTAANIAGTTVGTPVPVNGNVNATVPVNGSVNGNVKMVANWRLSSVRLAPRASFAFAGLSVSTGSFAGLTRRAAACCPPAGYSAAGCTSTGTQGLEDSKGSTRQVGLESTSEQHQDIGREAAGAGDPGS